MKNSLKSLLKITLMFLGLCLIFTVQAKADEEEYEYPHYVGVATATVNVREGAGVNFDQVTDDSGKKIQLSTGDEVEILEERKADDGIIWYHITFTQKGNTYTGFSTSTYVAKDPEKVITPTPTPSPEPVEEVTPVDPLDEPSKDSGSDQEGKKAKDPLAEDDASEEEPEEEEESKGSIIWTVVWVLLLLSVVFFAFFVVLNYIRHRAQGQPSTPARKVEKLKQINTQNKDAGRRVPQIRTTGARPAPQSEPRREVYVKRREPAQDNFVPASPADLEQDNEDKRILREKIEQLQEHDLVRHVVYGEGEVYDNSDVKLLEVRFGNDMRFLKKDQLVNKRELVVFDDEDQSIAKRRRRRVNNQSSRIY